MQAALNDDGTIETARLRLRPIRAGDAALFCALYADPAVMRHIGPPLDAGAARRAFDAALRIDAAAGWPGYRIVALREAPADIGLVALQRRKARPRTADAGVMLQGGTQGRGLGAEAIAGVVDWAFAHALVEDIHTRNAAGNIAVLRMMERQGFQAQAGQDPSQRYWRMTARAWREAGPLLPA